MFIFGGNFPRNSMLIYVHLRSITRQVLSSLYLALSLSHINTRVSVRESESRASPALFAERGTSVELFYRIRAMGICIVARGSYRKKERLSIERSTTTTTKIQSRLCDCYASDTHVYTRAYIQAVSNFMQNSYAAAAAMATRRKKRASRPTYAAPIDLRRASALCILCARCYY